MTVNGNNRLVDYLVERGVLKTPNLISAFRAVDRQWFVPGALADQSYHDYPLPIGFSQTISQPWTVAFMLELLAPKAGNKVLDIGAGSGWTTALLSHAVGEKGEVLGIEIIQELAQKAQEKLVENNIKNARIIAGDAGKIIEKQKFDRILVSAAAKNIPEKFISTLKPNGRLVIPIGEEGAIQTIYLVVNKKDKPDIQGFPGFAFVPLK